MRRQLQAVHLRHLLQAQRGAFDIARRQLHGNQEILDTLVQWGLLEQVSAVRSGSERKVLSYHTTREGSALARVWACGTGNNELPPGVTLLRPQPVLRTAIQNAGVAS